MVECFVEQPAYVHLRDTDFSCDLLLGELAEEPEEHNCALTLGQLNEQWAQQLPILDLLQIEVDATETVRYRLSTGS